MLEMLNVGGGSVSSIVTQSMSQEGSGLHQDRHGKRAAWSNGSQAAANDMAEVSSSEPANVCKPSHHHLLFYKWFLNRN
jgi:hypothetical protein